MAEKTVPETRSVFQVADDLEQLQNYLRITRELMTDQLCGYEVDNNESMNSSLEKIHLLTNMMHEKIAHMTVLNEELFSFCRAEKQALFEGQLGEIQII